jgi:predicted nucleotidyltransferase
MELASLKFTSPQIEQFCQKHHIRRLAFFGSVVRNDFKPDSDVDILVEFDPGHVPGFDFFLMELELSRLLNRKVDLQTENFISPEIRRYALSEAITAYEQA